MWSLLTLCQSAGVNHCPICWCPSPCNSAGVNHCPICCCQSLCHSAGVNHCVNLLVSITVSFCWCQSLCQSAGVNHCPICCSYCMLVLLLPQFCTFGRLASEVGWKYKDVVETLEQRRKVKSKQFYDRKRKLEVRSCKPVLTLLFMNDMYCVSLFMI